LLEKLSELLLDPYNENITYVFKVLEAFIKSLSQQVGQIGQEYFKSVSDFVL